MLFTMRYKARVGSALQGFLEADSLEAADREGRAYCDAREGYRFIAVDYAILNQRPKPEVAAEPKLETAPSQPRKAS